MTPRPSNRLRALASAAVLLCAPSLQAADPPPAPSAPPSTAASPPTRLSLWLDVAHSGLDKSTVRAAIEQELGTPVELTDTAATPLRVTIESDQRVRVAFTTASGEELSRTVDLPADPARRVEVIALMVGNLTRNEAADLLATLEAARNAPPPPAAKPEARSEPKQKTEPKLAEPAKPNALIRTDLPAINLSLFHPISLFPNSDRRVFKLELGLIYSRVGAIEGAALNFGAVRIEQHLRGYAFGGFFTLVGGSMEGFQSSYIYSESRGPVRGVTLGGLVLRHSAPLTGLGVGGLVEIGDDIEGVGLAGLVGLSHRVQGAQIGGLVAIATEPVEGLILGGLFAKSQTLDGIGLAGLAQVSGDAEGLQVSGLGNVSGDVRGASIGGLANVTGNVNGAAVSGLANVTGDVRGLSLSVVNVGQRVNGAQIGLVNVAGEVDGVQIGLVNIAKNGRISAEAFATNSMPINLGVRFVSGYSYSELAVGYDPVDRDSQYSGGLGAHLEASRFTVEAGVHGSSTQNAETNEKPTRVDLHYRGRVGYRITPFLEPFIGAGARHGMYNQGKDEVDPEMMAGVALF